MYGEYRNLGGDVVRRTVQVRGKRPERFGPTLVVGDAFAEFGFGPGVARTEGVEGGLELRAERSPGKRIHVFPRESHVQRDLVLLFGKSHDRPHADLREVFGDVQDDFLGIVRGNRLGACGVYDTSITDSVPTLQYQISPAELRQDFLRVMAVSRLPLCRSDALSRNTGRPHGLPQAETFFPLPA